jgi:O-Antigen ligase
MKLNNSKHKADKEEVQSQSTKESILLVLLGLFSFGGATGRLILGFGFFDLLLVFLLILSIPKIWKSYYKVKRRDFIVYMICFLIIAGGSLRAFYMGLEGSKNEFFITELRFFLYIPVLYFVTIHFKFNISHFEKVLPYIILVYLILWGVFLHNDSLLYKLFNGNDIQSIGNLERLNGPPILILVPLLFILIKEKNLKPLSLGLYTALILLVFVKTGGRTYFIFHSLPIFYLIYTKRKNLNFSFLAITLVIASFFLLKEFTNVEFFERFLSITNATEDTSFMYRIYNIQVMLNKLKGSSLWLGYGIGSNYEVNLYGWKMSFFLDNTFLTLTYKIGLIGLLVFSLLFFIQRKHIPIDLYFFEILSLLLVASISYHIILNPVFIYGYFLIKSYFNSNYITETAANESRNNKSLPES